MAIDSHFNTIEEALEAIQNGQMIIVVDDEHRENEGDLVMAAQHASPQAINFMTKYGRGLICMPIEASQAQRLNIPPMTRNNTDAYGTAFTVSIDHIDSTTGISAYERSHTILKACEISATADQFKRPGHIFPLVAKEGGVLQRAGHTEAAVDLARLSALEPAGVICEIMHDDGSMMRRDDLFMFAQEHGLKMITIADLIAYRLEHEPLMTLAAEAILPTEHGEFRLVGFENNLTGEHHVALVRGHISPEKPTLLRVHSECLTGDALRSLKCDCGDQLSAALTRINEENHGILLYLRQEGRGIGLINKIKAYALQDQGLDTVEANVALGLPEDARSYGIGAHILKLLGVGKIRLMTNNPTKIEGLKGYGLDVVERVPIQTNHHERSQDYLKTKKDKMGHILSLEDKR